MKLIAQGKDECALATIAMLADASLEEVREVALNASGVKSWNRTILNNTLYWKGINAVLEKWPVPFIDRVTRRYLVGIDDCDTGAINPKIKRYGPKEKPNLEGRGHLSVAFRKKFSRNKIFHAVAYEDGIIYDPARLDWEPNVFDVWLKNIKADHREILYFLA